MNILFLFISFFLAFLLSILLGGWGLIIYVALWIAMPLEGARAGGPLARTYVAEQRPTEQRL